MLSRLAKANVDPVRQSTQYTCTAASLAMALQAIGVSCDEKDVNGVLGCRPMRGASWDRILSAAQHFGARSTLVCPSTLDQLKAWTDAGTPVLIGWCPEGRPWGHASVVFDVQDDYTVLVADPNIPDPSEVVRVLSREDFYKKWYEPGEDYLIRRTAMAVEPEIVGGRVRTAARSRAASPLLNLSKLLRELQFPEGGRAAEVVLRNLLQAAHSPSRLMTHAPMTRNNRTQVPLEIDLGWSLWEAGKQAAGLAATAEWMRDNEPRLAPAYALLGKATLEDLRQAARDEAFWKSLGIPRGTPTKTSVTPHLAGKVAKFDVVAEFPAPRQAADYSWSQDIPAGRSVEDLERRYMPQDLRALVSRHHVPVDPSIGPEKILRNPAMQDLVAEAVFLGLRDQNKLGRLTGEANNYYLPMMDRRLVLRRELGAEDPGMRAAALRGYALWSALNQAHQIAPEIEHGELRGSEARWLMPKLRKMGYKPARKTRASGPLVERIARRALFPEESTRA